MTITDFVDILLHYHDQHGRTGAAIEVLASRSIAQVLSDPVAGTLFKHATEMFAQPSPLQPPSHDHAVDYGGLVAVDANGMCCTSLSEYHDAPQVLCMMHVAQ